MPAKKCGSQSLPRLRDRSSDQSHKLDVSLRAGLGTLFSPTARCTDLARSNQSLRYLRKSTDFWPPGR